MVVDVLVEVGVPLVAVDEIEEYPFPNDPFVSFQNPQKRFVPIFSSGYLLIVHEWKKESSSHTYMKHAISVFYIR